MVTIIAGARPNFIKIASIITALKGHSYQLIHTGQHYDYAMSQAFFDELNIPKPDVFLNAAAGSQTEQTASIMLAFEKELLKHKPKLVLVVGDVNSTMACTIVAKKLSIPVAHVEAGIRSYDMTMPEEINRLVTDSISDLFFTTTTWATENLVKSGIESNKIHFVGNVMIDTLLTHQHRFEKPKCWDDLGLNTSSYFVLTLHRPSNVDDADYLLKLLSKIDEMVGDSQVVFPVHPRTRKILGEQVNLFKNIKCLEPLGYLSFNYLVMHAKAVITDSGGITEEATVMNIPCITLRNTTERPETVEIGTNELVGNDMDKLRECIALIKNGKWKKGGIPEKWDGRAAERIVEVLKKENYLS